MKERAPQKTCEYIPVPDWVQANRELTRVVAGRPATLGSGHDYPHPIAYFTKDAWSGEGMGYVVWDTHERKLKDIIADIAVTGKTQTLEKEQFEGR